jgi:predicted nucleotidyltransferase
MTTSYGFTAEQLQLIQQILAAFPAVEKAILFGSRAKGSMHQRSDIDLALLGTSLDRHELAKIALAFDESDLPWQVDLKDLVDIHSQPLLDHIARVGKQIYPSSTLD